MPFEAGKPRPANAGRKKGTPNKRTWEARAIAERLGFCPVEQLVAWAQGDWKKLGYPGPTKIVVTKDGDRVEVDRIDEQLRQKSARDLVPYLLPQLKSIELGGDAAEKIASTLTGLISAAAGEGAGDDAGDDDADDSAAADGAEGAGSVAGEPEPVL